MSGNLQGYRVRIVNEETGVDIIRSSDETSLTINELDCCTDYSFSVTASTIDFGTQSEAFSYRTMPDLSGLNRNNTTVAMQCVIAIVSLIIS